MHFVILSKKADAIGPKKRTGLAGRKGGEKSVQGLANVPPGLMVRVKGKQKKGSSIKEKAPDIEMAVVRTLRRGRFRQGTLKKNWRLLRGKRACAKIG